MKRTSRASFRPNTWQLSLHIVLALLCLQAAPAFSTIDTLVVLHTNDFHGYISSDGDRAAGLARIATYFDRERARSSKVLALDAGDCVSGTPVSTLFQGRPIFEAMTAVGYDAVTLGNHEFDYGWRLIPISSIPWRQAPSSSSHLGASHLSGLPSRCGSKRI